ncbi:MAG: flagellar basal-body rod protein FlgG [Deltaproteobacteria bacterium RIFOXYA12_FULL_61_11]|nr:MAG: flagellar basal-body rod protein FlgG [Deltaproteobacteria bacterium RIFOXYA12_FULL_61_11]
MIRALFTAATGMEAQQLKIDNIANNLANVNTVGYKKSRENFEDLMYQNIKLPGKMTTDQTRAPVGIQIGHGTRTVALEKVFSQGSLRDTKQELDLAIEGNGFFQLKRPNGELAYTRAGIFHRTNDGSVVDPSGLPLDPPIIIPNDAVKVNIGDDGTVTVLSSDTNTELNVGRIELVNFINPSGLQAEGKNLYAPTEASGQPITGIPGNDGLGTLAQGFVESANVNVAEELINMILAQRAYEISSKVIQTSDQMIQNSNVLR